MEDPGNKVKTKGDNWIYFQFLTTYHTNLQFDGIYLHFPESKVWERGWLFQIFGCYNLIWSNDCFSIFVSVYWQTIWHLTLTYRKSMANTNLVQQFIGKVKVRWTGNPELKQTNLLGIFHQQFSLLHNFLGEIFTYQNGCSLQ